MIYNHLSELPSQVLTNRLCCVLIFALILYWQRKNISTNVNSGGDRRLIPAAVYMITFLYLCELCLH